MLNITMYILNIIGNLIATVLGGLILYFITSKLNRN